MKQRKKQWMRTGLFLAGGGLAGLIWYQFFGCTTGCPITSSPWMTMGYMAMVGGLLSGVIAPTKRED